MSMQSNFSHNQGIAIGPILFIIALLAILAAAIAAGSGGFTGSTTNENSKIMASTILQWANNMDVALEAVEGNGYNVTQVSFDVFSGTPLTTTADGTDWEATGFYSNANCTVDACMIFKPKGGGVVLTAWPLSASGGLANLQNYWGSSLCTNSNNEACRNPFNAGALSLIAVPGIASASAPQQGLAGAPGVDINVCIEINNLVGVQNPGGLPPVLGTDILSTSIATPSNLGFDQTSAVYASIQIFTGAIITGKKDFCLTTAGYTDGFYFHVFL